MNLVEIYEAIWKFILTVLDKAGIAFDTSKVPAWLNVPSI